MKKRTQKSKSRGNGEGTIFQRTVRGKKLWVTEYVLGTTKER